LVSGSADKTARVWDVEEEEEKANLGKYKQGVWAVAFSPDGQWLATGCSHDSNAALPAEIKLFDAKTLKERAGADWAKRPALSLAFSPDSARLAAGAPGSPAVTVYDVKSGKQLTTVAGSASVQQLAFAPDGKTLATAHGTGGSRG